MTAFLTFFRQLSHARKVKLHLHSLLVPLSQFGVKRLTKGQRVGGGHVNSRAKRVNATLKTSEAGRLT